MNIWETFGPSREKKPEKAENLVDVFRDIPEVEKKEAARLVVDLYKDVNSFLLNNRESL